MIKIIFVCLGNICRSPLAEAICRQKIKDLGWEEKVSCDSAGTANYHIGDDPDNRSVRVATDHGIPISHKGQQFTRGLAKEFDYWIAMDQSNLRKMIIVFGEKPENLLLMRNFDTQENGTDVPDPYYGGQDGFENVFQILDRSIDEFLSSLKEKHGL